ncbi:DUF5683 domain-containing protein [Pedobacter chitinilyticus]|uniref:DUF5683 domain-containing protein n=1 Tax=Pedobacter chitinilyticus TaxID=2233776 RepID=A0A3S3SSZ2_9SPHI|nr:DUF5683 domain-containing protein [Pedobacter chitinilyticus]RWU08652.1 hypothetical protein DPV69_09810 [Pedobacter chitinilyticus]
MRALLLSVVICFTFAQVNAQKPVSPAKQDTTAKLDTIAPAKYVNQGKIAGKKAVYRSLMFPGLGQLYNYGLVVDDVKNGRTEGKRIGQKIYLIGKIGAIYAGGTILVMSYIDNNNNYKRFLRELQYRQANNNAPDPNNGLTQYPDVNALTVAKNIYKRNREVVLISLVGLYGLNVLDAYVTARLKYFNVDESLSIKLSPSIINTNTMYGLNIAPALKLTLKL